MSRFLAGFCFASLLWGGLLYAHTQGIVTLGFLASDVAPPEEVTADAQTERGTETGKKRRRKWKKRPRKRRELSGTAMTGDNLGGPDTRHLNAAEGGGEEQLVSSEIEAGFDRAFPKIRRCLMLVDSHDPVRGKLTFGLRIAGTGRITKVNLKGPAVVTRSEAGGCMRNAAKSIQFRTFNGPDMLVHFPITLD